MLKKLGIVAVLLTVVWALSVPNAHGYPGLVKPGGWGSITGSVCVWSDWKGLANVEIKPALVEVLMTPYEVVPHYLNPGGNGGGWGNPFYPSVILVGQDAVNYQSVTKNGSYQSWICFSDQEIYNAVGPANFPPPQNPNWTLDLENILVTQMYVHIFGYSDDPTTDPIYPDFLTSEYGGTCTLPVGATSYSCTEDLRIEYALPRK